MEVTSPGRHLLINDKTKRDYDDYYNRSFPNESVGMNNVLALTAKGMPFVQALIKAHHLPDARWTRRLLHDRPFFYTKIIKIMSMLFKNKDYQKGNGRCYSIECR